MTNYRLRYQETYESFYDVEADSFEEAKAMLEDDLENERVNTMEQCLHSGIYYVPEVETSDQSEYRVIADLIDDLDGNQKDFILWLLLPRYIEMCNKEIKEAPKTKAEIALAMTLRDHRRVAEEMREVLATNLW